MTAPLPKLPTRSSKSAGASEEYTVVADAGKAGATTSGDRCAYELLRMVARGGMGEVWEAEQLSLGRRVAVKRLREEANETPRDRSIREFEFHQEAHVAAALEHPNILPVHDFGVDEHGAPLLAMKFVEGKPWHDLIRADLPTLPEEEFLSRHIPILMAMAQAVAFAHSRGIVHRDLKPAQVMVGAFGEVLLTDWGLAVRLADGDRVANPTESQRIRWGVPTPVTASNPAGTPSMMAPEQTRLDGSAIGPWTDVYLLGGTLYLLLSGSFPHSARTSTESMARAALGKIDPPSQRAPGRRIPQELESLCLHALQGDPFERIPSASAFWEALDGHVRGTARRSKSRDLCDGAAAQLDAPAPAYDSLATVLAHLDDARQQWPDNPAILPLRTKALATMIALAVERGDLAIARMQAEQLVALDDEAGTKSMARVIAAELRARRRRTIFRATAAAAFLLAVAVAIGSVLFTIRIDRANEEIAMQRDRAREAETLAKSRAEEAERNLTIARDQGEGALELIDFVLRDLKTALDSVLTEEQGVPKDRANALAHAIAGRVTEPVIRYYDSLDISQWPVAYQQEHLAQRGDAVLRLNELGQTQQGLELTSRSLPLFERAYGVDHPIVGTLNGNIGLFLSQQRDFNGAIEYFQRAMHHRESSPETAEHHLAQTLNQLGGTLRLVGRTKEAAEAHERAMEIYDRTFGPDNADTLRAMNNLAMCMRDLGDRERALELFRDALAIKETTVPPDSPELVAPLTNYSRQLLDTGSYDESIELVQRALRIATESLGPKHRRTAMVQHSLVDAYQRAGRFEEAEVVAREVHAANIETMGPAHPESITAITNLGFVLRKRGKFQEALELNREALRRTEESFGPNSHELLSPMNQLAETLEEVGLYPEARSEYERSVVLAERILGLESEVLIRPLAGLAKSYLREERFAEARVPAERMLTLRRKLNGDTDPHTAAAMSIAANALAPIGETSAALALARESVRITEGNGSTSIEELLARRRILGVALLRHGDLEAARASLEESLARARAELPPSNSTRIELVESLVDVLLALGEHEAADAATLEQLHEQGTDASAADSSTARAVRARLKVLVARARASGNAAAALDAARSMVEEHAAAFEQSFLARVRYASLLHRAARHDEAGARAAALREEANAKPRLPSELAELEALERELRGE